MIDLFRRGSGRRFPSWSGAVAEAESNMSRRQKEVCVPMLLGVPALGSLLCPESNISPTPQIAMNTFYHGAVPIAVVCPLACLLMMGWELGERERVRRR